MSKRVNVSDRINNPITSAITAFTTQDETKNEKSKDTNSVLENNTKSVTKNDTHNSKINETEITQVKSIKIGNTVFKSTYKSNDETKRAAYFLRQDTIEKIEKCSKLSSLKKAELVDLILNNILTDILNKIDK